MYPFDDAIMHILRGYFFGIWAINVDIITEIQSNITMYVIYMIYSLNIFHASSLIAFHPNGHLSFTDTHIVQFEMDFRGVYARANVGRNELRQIYFNIYQHIFINQASGCVVYLFELELELESVYSTKTNTNMIKGDRIVNNRRFYVGRPLQRR